MADLPTPKEGILLTDFIVSAHVEPPPPFYTQLLAAEPVDHGDSYTGSPTITALANVWVTTDFGGESTPDKPTVTLRAPSDPNNVSSFLNIRVADIESVYKTWSGRGAEFLTPPIDRGIELR